MDVGLNLRSDLMVDAKVNPGNLTFRPDKFGNVMGIVKEEELWPPPARTVLAWASPRADPQVPGEEW